MNAIRQALSRALRSRAACRLLKRCGIDPKRYWLLVDLFGQISERGEITDQLGSNEIAMKTAALMYCLLSAVIALAMLATGRTWAQYFPAFAFLTVFLMLVVLLAEASNSLVNPVEGVVLAHQPIDGATYAAAKLSHLARIVLFLAPAINGIPAVAGLMLKDARWFQPLIHISATLGLGFLVALLCCAVFGWLIRFFPARRLRAAGQIAAALPLVFMPCLGAFTKLDPRRWLPPHPAAQWGFAIACGAAAAAIVGYGIRSLSADYLIRVSTLMRGGSAAASRPRRSRLSALVARFFGGQAGRAAFSYASRMVLRDYQFRRQMIMSVFFPIMIASMAIKGLRIDAFSGRFTTMHLIPHFLGGMLFLVSIALPFGSDHKAAWFFLTVPNRMFGGFARGIYALLWIWLVVVPTLVLFLPLIWFWGAWHALLFVAYSFSAASVYAALTIRMIDAVPFTRQMDVTRGSAQLPIILLGMLAMAAAVGLQYAFVFRSQLAVILTTAAAGAAAVFLTRRSLAALERSMRYNLGLLSVESGTLYKEIGA